MKKEILYVVRINIMFRLVLYNCDEDVALLNPQLYQLAKSGACLISCRKLERYLEQVASIGDEAERRGYLCYDAFLSLGHRLLLHCTKALVDDGLEILQISEQMGMRLDVSEIAYYD